MALLTILSLIYAAILVLALAISLIVILYYLWRIGTSLAAARDALAAVAEATESLETPMEQLQHTTEHLEEQGEQAQASLDAAAEHLSTLVEPAVAGRQRDGDLS